MTISGIGAASQTQANTGIDPASWQTQMQQMLGPVAQLFGESTQQLTNDLQSGKTSLTQLADAKGISQTDLLSAIQQGLQQSKAFGGTQLSGTQLTNLANGIANRVHGGHHHHHDGGSPTSSATGASNAGATPGSTSTDPLSAIEQDLQQLLTDLGTALSPNGSAGTSASTGIDQLF
jgi:hypothetical protein